MGIFIRNKIFYLYYTLKNAINIIINPRAGPATSPIVIELPEENEFTCPADGLFPDVNSGCKAYYNCNGGQVWRYNCPPGLKFDASYGQTGSCNWEQMVDDNCNCNLVGCQ